MSTPNALQPYEQLKEIIANNDNIRTQFENALGPRYRNFLAALVNLVFLNPNLAECTPMSIITSALKAATLDLKIDPELGQAWIIPYKVKGVAKAQFQIGYLGYIQMALRTGKYRRINVGKIYAGETIEEDRFTGDITILGEKISDEIIGYCGYISMVNGFEKFFYMSIDDIKAHAQRYSKSYQFAESAWKTNFGDMCKKTILRLMLKKYGQFDNGFEDEPEEEGEPMDLNNFIDARADEPVRIEEPASAVNPEIGQIAF